MKISNTTARALTLPIGGAVMPGEPRDISDSDIAALRRLDPTKGGGAVFNDWLLKGWIVLHDGNTPEDAARAQAPTVAPFFRQVPTENEQPPAPDAARAPVPVTVQTAAPDVNTAAAKADAAALKPDSFGTRPIEAAEAMIATQTDLNQLRTWRDEDPREQTRTLIDRRISELESHEPALRGSIPQQKQKQSGR